MLSLAVTVSRNINKARTALFINTPAYGITVIMLLDGPQNLEISNLTPFMEDAEKKAEFPLDKSFENQGIPPAESAKKSFRWIPRSTYVTHCTYSDAFF